MINLIKKYLVLLRNYLIYKKFSFLAAVTKKKFPLDPNADFVISVASYPGRIKFLPAVFEALTRQTVQPKYAYIVLAEEEWSDQIIPKYIKKLINRGIKLIWTKNNPYAVKKLVPIIKKHPDLGVITLDDDLIYDSRVIEMLVKDEFAEKNYIVGHVGKALFRNADELKMFFRQKDGATIFTDSNQVYLIGGGGIYYPSNSLDPRVTDMEAIKRIVPGRGSDIWFWAAAIAKGTKQICLGTPPTKNLFIPIPQNKKSEPRDRPGAEVMEKRFQMAIDFFGIRQKLLETLPDRAD